MSTSYTNVSDGISVWPQFHNNNNEYVETNSFEQHQPPFKRQRNSEEENNQSNTSMPFPPINHRMPPPNAPINKGTTNIFWKTRMCVKFKTGLCRNGENCNFAHGIEDLRQPPPNWQELVGGRDEDRGNGNWEDDQKIIQRMKLCKKFYNGEECPYGERCNFLHEDPRKFRDDSTRFRESSAISIGTTGNPPALQGRESDQVEGNMAVNGTDSSRLNGRPVYWKTKLCSRYETTGLCPFGDKCHFAHGQAELQTPGGRTDGEFFSTDSLYSIPKPLVLPSNNLPSVTNISNGILPKQEGSEKKWFSKLNGSKKINLIYGDWLDDLPLMQSLPGRSDN